MSDLLAQARGVLERTGFATSVAGADAVTCDFEDVSIMGRVHVVDLASTLLAEWERLHQLAVSEGTSIQQLAVTGLSKVFTAKGLPGISI